MRMVALWYELRSLRGVRRSGKESDRNGKSKFNANKLHRRR